MAVMQMSRLEPEQIEREVSRWTSGRVRNLQVSVNGREVVLQGRSDTYYVKQLAQQGVLEAVPSASVHNAIEVL